MALPALLLLHGAGEHCKCLYGPGSSLPALPLREFIRLILMNAEEQKGITDRQTVNRLGPRVRYTVLCCRRLHPSFPFK